MKETAREKLLAEWGDKWGVRALESRAEVKTAPRLKTSLGRCRPATGRITLNPILERAGNEALMEEILCHEAAHLAVYLLYGRKPKPHGREWKALMSKAGYAPRARVREEDVKGPRLGPRRSGHVYVHVCRDCSAVYRALKTDRRWRCARCTEAGLGGRLVLAAKLARNP